MTGCKFHHILGYSLAKRKAVHFIFFLLLLLFFLFLNNHTGYTVYSMSQDNQFTQKNGSQPATTKSAVAHPHPAYTDDKKHGRSSGSRRKPWPTHASDITAAAYHPLITMVTSGTVPKRPFPFFHFIQGSRQADLSSYFLLLNKLNGVAANSMGSVLLPLYSAVSGYIHTNTF